MSWSFSVPAGPASEFAERAAQAADDCRASLNAPLAEVVDDIDTAVAVADELASALTGTGDAPVVANLSGNANQGRTPPPGWSPDTITVSVARVAAS